MPKHVIIEADWKIAYYTYQHPAGQSEPKLSDPKIVTIPPDLVEDVLQDWVRYRSMSTAYWGGFWDRWARELGITVPEIDVNGEEWLAMDQLNYPSLGITVQIGSGRARVSCDYPSPRRDDEEFPPFIHHLCPLGSPEVVRILEHRLKNYEDVRRYIARTPYLA